MTEETQTTIVLSPEKQRESEKKDMLLMRKLDKKLGTKFYEIKDVITEMNLRFQQYRGMMDAMSIEYRILQSVFDFNCFVTPLQIIKKGKKITVNVKQPVASLKDGTLIYVGKDNDFNIFTTEKPKE